jgi:hypothetical protein
MAKRSTTISNWSDAYVATQQRLSEPLWWFPYPILIAIGMVLILTGHLVFAINPRMGHPASLINFPAQMRPDSAIWFSMTPIDHDIVITTNDRLIFRWPQDLTPAQTTQPFVAYLRRRVAIEIDSAALLKRAPNTPLTVVIAADQRLKYLHLRPVIAALAEAGITSYAFETLVIASTKRASSHGSSSGGHSPE